MYDKLVAEAKKVLGKFYLDEIEKNQAGCAAAAIMTSKGNVYTGICAELRGSLGFCAETAAVAEMLKARESEIKMLVVINRHGKMIPPCGRCREMLFQLNPKNLDMEIIFGDNEVKKLRDLLPDLWTDYYL